MLFDIITLFPEIFPEYIHQSIVKRAQEKGLVNIRIHNLRDFALDKHRKVDDVPYGGGPGMVLMAEPLYRAVMYLSKEDLPVKRILLSPQGRFFSQRIAEELSKESHLLLVCGHYEGLDQRIRDSVIDDEISIGDYILTGGELPALVVLDSVTRLIPGVLGSGESLKCESFLDSLLDYPQYTRPEIFNTIPVPKVLLSGHHEKIRKWRRKQSLIRTYQKRPDLFQKIKMTDEDIELLKDSS